MNISIDLLPQRTRRREGSLPIIPVAGLVSIITWAVVLTFTYLDVRNNVRELESQVEVRTEHLSAVEADLLAMISGINELNYVDDFTAMNSFLTGMYKSTIALKDQVYFHLPENVSVQRYDYNNQGDLILQITSTSKGDAAVYLNRLLHEREVSRAEVNTIALQSEDGVMYQSNYTLKLKTLAGEGNE